jgi:PAS domain S-box-containing protein
MRFLNSVKSLYSAVGILFLTVVLGVYVDYQNETLHARHLEINSGLEKMVRLNQELTSMLLVAVLEKNALRAASYDTVNNDLEETIRTVANLTTTLNLPQEVSDLSEGHNRLKAIEKNVLSLMSGDKWKEARAVLFSDEYQLAKKTYEIDSESVMSAVMGQLVIASQRFSRIRTVSLGMRIGALVLLFFIGIMFSRRTRADLAEQILLRSEIEASNVDLEQRVNDRTEALRLSAMEMEQQASLEATLSNLNVRVQTAQNISEVAKHTLDTMVGFFEAARGALFVLGAAGRLHRRASYAFPPHTSIPDSFGPNEGTIGKCALKGEPILTAPPDQSFWIHFGIGSVPPVQVLTYPLKSSGTLVGVVELCLIEPVSERQSRWLEKASESIATALRIALEREERQTAEERIHLILASTDEGIFGMDTEGYVTFVNPSACTMLGHDEQNIIGKPFHAMFHHSHADGSPYPEEHCTMGRAFMGEHIRAVDTEVFWGYDGTVLPVEYSATPIYQDNEVIGSVVSFRDITERKRIDSMKVAKEVAEEAAMRAEQARQAMERAQEDLKAKVQEIERFNRLALDREKRVIELKGHINELLLVSGREPAYKSTAEEPPLASQVDGRPQKEDRSGARAFIANLQTEYVKAMMDAFCNAVNVASAIIDLEGNVLVASRWQRLCTDFHRQNEGTCKRCIESDTELALHLEAGKEYTIYRCKNGLIDAAAPIIIENDHVANVFIGQFFSSPPDIAFFEAQAEEFGFDRAKYLAAVGDVPVVDEVKLPDILGFLRGFARFVALLSREITEAETSRERLAEERGAALSVAEDAVQARAQLAEYQTGLERIITERTEELERRAHELEEFNKVMIGRESRVIELKEEINTLCAKLGQPPAYPPVWDESTQPTTGEGQEV